MTSKEKRVLASDEESSGSRHADTSNITPIKKAKGEHSQSEEQTISTSVTNRLTDAERLLEAINKGRSLRHISTIDENNLAVKMKIKDTSLVKALLDFHSNPFSFDPTHHPNVLKCDSLDQDSPVDTRQFYIRLYTVTKEDLEKYRDQYRADSKWAQDVLQQCEGVVGTFTIPYVGMTLRGSPGSRAKQDSITSDPTRRRNLETCVGSPDVFEWVTLRLKETSLIESRVNSVGDDIERNLIALVTPQCLNSASGGSSFQWEPKPEFLSAVHAAVPRTGGPSIMSVPLREKDLQDRARAHLGHAYRIIQASFPENTVATAESMQQIILDATSDIRPLGARKTLSVFIPSDITMEMAKGGADYMSPTAGPAPKLELHIRQLLGVANKEDSGFIRMPRHDLWSFATVDTRRSINHGYAATMMLSLYLQTMEPVIIVSQSAVMAKVCLGWEMARVWGSAAEADRALAEIHSLHGVDDLKQFLRGNESDWAHTPHRRFTEHLGMVSVVKYGPKDHHRALCIFERDPGSVRYDPAFQNLYSEQHLLCKAVYVLACRQVARMQRDIQASSDSNFSSMMVKLIEAVNKDIETSGVGALLEQKKTDQKQANEAVSIRVQAIIRKVYSRGDHLGRKPTALGPPVDQALLDEDNDLFPDIPCARVEQWKDLMGHHHEQMQSGSKVESRLCPLPFDFLSLKHRNWFLSREENYHFQQGVSSTGKKMTKKEGYDETRAKVGYNNRKPTDATLAMKNLADPSYQERAKQYVKWTCKLCTESGASSIEGYHRCLVLEETEIDPNKAHTKDIDLSLLWMNPNKNKNTTEKAYLWQQAIQYPHSFYEATDEDQREKVNACGEFIMQSAEDVIAEAPELDQEAQEKYGKEQLGPIFYLPDSTDEWKLTMAIDRLLERRCQATFTLYSPKDQDLTQDDPSAVDKCWLKNLSYRSLLDHIKDRMFKHKPVLVATCIEECGKRSLVYRRNRADTTSLGQHKCQGIDKSIKLKLEADEVRNYFEIPTELARRFWLDARTKEERADSVIKMLQWNIQGRD
ncbi:hypothetical protein MVEG_02512 [Podila verticillata NRRL 6337]|nr:hypothetical protein MVEG_02512 [Podila verticillata NRRL 6337]